MKWWILSACVLTLFLSFGKNFPLISDLFFNYFPLYNKFRAVESILVIPGLLVPVLALLAVREAAAEKTDIKELEKYFRWSVYITGGILLAFIAIPTLFFNFRSSGHEQLVQQLAQVTQDQSFANTIANALIDDRISMARADAFRSLLFLAIGAALLWGIFKRKIKPQPAYIILAIAVTIDMWQVDRRYLNNDSFVEESRADDYFKPREVDQLILRDQSLDYRVMDLTIPTFSSASSSYFHKTVGGYHAAKLKRFQEVIDKQFNNAINEDVLDMLNTKYLITSSGNGESQKIVNRSTAAGNAWFVQDITWVKSADEEMKGINSFDPKKEAIVHEEFKNLVNEKVQPATPSAAIKLVNYHPDHLTYEYTTPAPAVAVFAEIWYDKGWNAYVDGEKIPHFRADYILRAAQLPAGNHKLEFKFEPVSYYTGETISLIASILLIAGLAFAVYIEVRKKKETKAL